MQPLLDAAGTEALPSRNCGLMRYTDHKRYGRVTQDTCAKFFQRRQVLAATTSACSDHQCCCADAGMPVMRMRRASRRWHSTNRRCVPQQRRRLLRDVRAGYDAVLLQVGADPRPRHRRRVRPGELHDTLRPAFPTISATGGRKPWAPSKIETPLAADQRLNSLGGQAECDGAALYSGRCAAGDANGISGRPGRRYMGAECRTRSGVRQFLLTGPGEAGRDADRAGHALLPGLCRRGEHEFRRHREDRGILRNTGSVAAPTETPGAEPGSKPSWCRRHRPPSCPRVRSARSVAARPPGR